MANTNIAELKSAAYWTATKYQQNYYEAISDWNKYNADEHVYLKNYIGYALYGPPEYEKVVGDDADGVYMYEKEGATTLIDSIFDQIVEHGTQLTESKEVLCSAIYCCIYDDSSLLKCDIDKLQETIQNISIFKIQKAIKTKDKDRKEIITYENWYVDTEARVYKSWDDYLTNNNLPTCTMIAPKNGVYQADLREVWSDDNSPVWVEVHRINTSKIITNSLDTASTIVSVGCIGIGIASVLISAPISAPIVIAGAVGGVASGIYSGGRAAGELIDRSTHNQSISIVNKQALPAWLGVAGSTLGLAASGGSALLSRAIRAGSSVGKGAQLAHDAVMVGNLVVNYAGIGYGGFNVYKKYCETGEISSKDILFLSAHIFFTCNSTIKNRFASDIIKSDQKQILQDYENSLRSNRHRKEFRRLVRNTGEGTTSEIQRNEQIIRSLTKINNRDDFFATIVQNRKTFASTGTKLSFADGHVQINGESLITPSEFASMSKDSIRNVIIKKASTNTLTSSSHVTPVVSSSTVGSFNISENMLKTGISIVHHFCVEKGISLSIRCIRESCGTIISDLQNCTNISEILLTLLESGMCIAEKVMNAFYSREQAIQDATNYIWNYVKSNLERKIPGIKIFNSLCQEIIHQLVQATYDYVKSKLSEWCESFRQYLRDNSNIDLKQNSKSEEIKEKEKILYDDITVIDPVEVLTLGKAVSSTLIKETLITTGSRIKSVARLPKDLLKLCYSELNDFFTKHPTKLEFKLDDLSKEFNGILFDLCNFEKKDIIFYKLIVISMNILQGLTENNVVKKDEFVNVMKGLWIFVNINFSQILPNTFIFIRRFESTVINIIISIYKYQLIDPSKYFSIPLLK